MAGFLFAASPIVAVWGVSHLVPTRQVVVAVLTALTGARTPVPRFKACPVVMALCTALLLVGSAS